VLEEPGAGTISPRPALGAEDADGWTDAGALPVGVAGPHAERRRTAPSSATI